MAEAKKTEEKPKVEETKKAKSGTGLEPNVAALLAYLLGVIGLVFYFIEKDNKFVRFAGMQSFLLGIAFWAITWIIGIVTFGFGFLVTPVLSIGYVVLVVMLMIKAYNNEEWELPVIGKFARDAVNK